LLICGSEELDLSKLERVAEYYGYVPHSPTVRHLWEILYAYPLEMKKRFLFFTTGSDRIPFEGIGQLALKITRDSVGNGKYVCVCMCVYVCVYHSELT
jgi:HECT-domain (ubiquitin-transferase)